MTDEKQTYRTEVPLLLTLVRATLDVNEALRVSLGSVADPSDIKMVEKAIEKNKQVIKRLNELLAEHDKQPEVEARGLIFESLINAAKRLTSTTNQSLVFSYLGAWMSALRDQYNAVQISQLSQTLDNLLTEHVESIGESCIRFKQRSFELKDRDA